MNERQSSDTLVDTRPEMDPSEDTINVAPPTVGRIVLVRDFNMRANDDELPAIVVAVHGPHGSECITAQVFRRDADGTRLATSLLQQQKSGSKKHGWRWPPRV